MLARDVLVVPNAAVIRDRDASYVDLVGPHGQVTRTRFEPGAVGGENTAIVSGSRRPIALITAQRTKVETDAGGLSSPPFISDDAHCVVA